MPRPSSHRLFYGMFAVAAAAICAAAWLRIGPGTGHARASSDNRERSQIETAAIPAPVGSDVIPTSDHEDRMTDRPATESRIVESTASTEHRSVGSGGASIFANLPKSLAEQARTTSWDHRTSAALDLFVLATFDADGNGTLDDLERINAVRAMRDAAWPKNATGAVGDNPGESAGNAPDTTLTEQDRQWQHDVDEARRRDRQEDGGAGEVAAEFRTELVRRFQIEDDGHLTVAEFERYMIHRKNRSSMADLNSDGRIDDADLRVFLDVASPIADSSEAPADRP